MATISCSCGEVKLQVPSTSPRVSTECCCHHCFARVQYLEDLGGPKVPSKPILNSKWTNKVKILSGKEKLWAYKMTPETMVINIASSCCHTFLLGRHSEYDANSVTTSNDFPNISGAEGIKPASRWFSNQWDTERLSKYPKVIGIWVNEKDGSIVGEQGWEEVFEDHMTSINMDIEAGAEGMSFDEILDEIGRDMIEVVSSKTKKYLPPS